MKRVLPLLVMLAARAGAQHGTAYGVSHILAPLAFGDSCTSTVELRNLSAEVVSASLEAHRAGGALFPLEGQEETALHLEPHERRTFKIAFEEAGSAWIGVSETEPAVLAVTAITECIAGNRLRTVTREAASPMRNPWFSGDIGAHRGSVFSVVNTVARAAVVSICYSSGDLFSAPQSGVADLTPLCSAIVNVQIPPFGMQQFPVESGGSSYCSLKTKGERIAIELLRPLEGHTQLYSVDSAIKFGGEVPAGRESPLK